MGTTNLGNLVGMGRQNYLNVNFMIFYILFIFAHKFIHEEDKAIKVSSIIAIIGLINIPIIKYSVDWWNTLHQPKSISLIRGKLALFILQC